jgi:putative DNA methylase
MEYKKKLIEVALPLEAINAESAREKSIRHGHPSTLHLWWARRPLATARAVIWSSLVDDPSSHPEEFSTEEAQNKERQRLFGILGRLVKWQNSNNMDVLAEAKAEIMKSTGGNPPDLLDPFAGGGTIPLEAQRLGLKAYASDLNPVAVMINKAMIEIPPKFAGQPPVNPDAHNQINSEWKGASGLAEDVRYYGEWMQRKAFEKIGHLYPKVKDEQGRAHAVIAWIWTRTVMCPNPACGCEMPLANSFELSKKKGKEAYIHPVIEGKKIRYEVKYGKGAQEPPKTGRGHFKCICCGEPVQGNYIKAEGVANRIGYQLIAIVGEGKGERLYFSANTEHINAAEISPPQWYPDGELFGKAADQLPLYGYKTFKDLFTNRQLVTLMTLSDLVDEAQKIITADGGSKEYAQAVGVYLAFGVSRNADINNTLCRWEISKTQVRNLFTRQAIAMMWDFAENNVFGNAAGGFSVSLSSIIKVIERFSTVDYSGNVMQHDAQKDNNMRNIMVSTDPPYYDNICYADLSDFFYVWLRKMLRNIYPDIFHTLLVPKMEELVATPYRFDGGQSEAKEFFENGMLRTFKQIYVYVRDDIPTTVYYAYKQSEDYSETEIASTGWETMLSAVIQAGFSLIGTWPMRTELSNRMIGMDTNALASSIVLVCRKRPIDALTCTRRDFINALKRELKPSLIKLQASNIAPVDLAQSAIGPGMGVYSRYSKVLEADGTPMSVRSALQIINQELDHFFTEQDGELDRDSRFCVDIYTQYAFNDVRFGEADVLARAKNTSVEKLNSRGVLYAQKGVVRLLTREEIPDKTDRGIIWLLTQQLTHALEKDGVVGAAQIIEGIITSEPEQAKALAYRLFTIAERKGWASEAYAYNTLVIMWPDVQAKAAELQSQRKNGKQIDMFNI